MRFAALIALGLRPTAVVSILCSVIVSCMQQPRFVTDYARAYPLNDAAQKTGVPTISFIRGANNGRVDIVMPDGEVLSGEFQVLDNRTVATAFDGFNMVTAVQTGGVTAMAAAAIGNRGTSIDCRGSVDRSLHGIGMCETNKGARYRIMY